MSEPEGGHHAASRPKRRRRILTGDRPTGAMHLGHYVGSLANRVKLQDEYDCFFLIADLHMLTTRNTRRDVEAIAVNAREIVLDWLSVGMDPTRSAFYLQSTIPGIYRLNTLFQNLVTVPRLERLPSLKDMARDAGRDEMPYGLLGYPVLQAADILCVRGDLVPVGKDNIAHVEVTREIARRFNRLYGHVFPLPEGMVGDVPTLPGTDGGEKMGKSLGNAIFLSDSAEVVRHKVSRMYTDPNRVRADIPGRVEGNPVFVYHDVFNDDRDEVEDLKRRYRAGAVGDIEVKEKLAGAINRFLDPIRERRAEYERQPKLVRELLHDGIQRTRAEVRETMRLVQEAMGFTKVWADLTPLDSLAELGD